MKKIFKKKVNVQPFFEFIYYFIKAIFKTIFIDLFVNIKNAFIFSFNKEERFKIKRELEDTKMVKLINERLKRVERLLYSIFEDGSYVKSDRGKSDLNELKKETK